MAQVGKKLLKTPEGKRKIPASLKQKMAQAVAPARPSLVPAGILHEKPKPDKVVRPSIEQLLEEGDDRRELRTLIAQQSQLNQQIKKLDAEKKPLETRIKAILGSYGISSMECDGLPVSYVSTGRSSIDGTLLLAAGVSDETIKLCTRTSDSMRLNIGKAEAE